MTPLPADSAKCATSRESQVRSQLIALNDSINYLNDNIANLEDKLSHVLRSEEPEVENKPSPPCDPKVPLANELENRVDHSRRLNDKLNSIMDRLEL